MERSYINLVSLLTRKHFYKLIQNRHLEKKDISINGEIIGYGIEGYIVASFYAAINKKNVSFCRSEYKNHGTRKLIDGMVNRNSSYNLFCLEKDLEKAVETLTNKGIEIKKIYIFCANNLDNIEKIKCNWHCDKSQFNHIHNNCKINSYVNKITGKEFTLSSGIKSNEYNETLPAANNIELINKVIKEKKPSLMYYKKFIGIGYGGVYFSILASLICNKDLLIYYNAEESNLEYENMYDVVYFDDYISTGKNLKKAINSCENVYNKKALVLYACEDISMDNIDIDICCIL